MPDGHGVRCYRVEIDCGGRTLRPIIAAANEREAREKAALLAAELCRLRLPWQKGGEDAPPSLYSVGDAIRVHRWWTA